MEDLLMELIRYAGDDYDADQDTFLLGLLNDALEEVINVLYPWGFNSESHEEKIKGIAMKRYRNKIRKIAEYHYDKQGREGTVSWSENGSSVSYESSGTPSSYFQGIIPMAKLV